MRHPGGGARKRTSGQGGITIIREVIPKLQERQGLRAFRLNAFNARIAIHLLVEGVDLRHTELSGEGKMVTVSVVKGRLTGPEAESIDNGVLFRHQEGRQLDKLFEDRSDGRLGDSRPSVKDVNGFEYHSGWTENPLLALAY